MTKILLILLIGLVFEAIGVVMLNHGLKQLDPVERIDVPTIVRVVKQGATNLSLLGGVFFEALFFGALLILMSRSDVSFIWPLTSLGFVLTTIAARFYLKEEVSLWRWCGVSLIMLGAGLITWTEQQKNATASPAPPAPPTASAPSPAP